MVEKEIEAFALKKKSESKQHKLLKINFVYIVQVKLPSINELVKFQLLI